MSEAETLSPAFRHALRTPLNQILGYSELLIEDAEAQGLADLLPDLHKIQSAGRDLQGLIEGGEHGEAVGEPDLRGVLAVAAGSAEETSDDRLAYLQQFLPPEPKEEGEVLVVDDYEENREVLARLLQRRGYTVTSASTGEEALALLRERLDDRPFELLLLDIVMPDMDGWEVLQRAKADERLAELPVIMISGLDEVDAVVRCLELGAADFVAKPFEPAILRARLSMSLEAKRSRDREHRLYEQLGESYRQLREYVASEEVV